MPHHHSHWQIIFFYAISGVDVRVKSNCNKDAKWSGELTVRPGGNSTSSSSSSCSSSLFFPADLQAKTTRNRRADCSRIIDEIRRRFICFISKKNII